MGARNPRRRGARNDDTLAEMRLSAPKQTTWFIALGIGVLGVVLHYGILHIGLLAPYAFLLVAGALALLLAASLAREL